MVFLVHHADAVAPEIDAQRPLSVAGRLHAERLAASAAARGVRPSAIWHSGKLRARQTADAFWKACNPLADMAAARGLQPTDPPEMIAAQLSAQPGDVMLVGHLPHLDRLHEFLLRTSAGEPRTPFPQHGLVAMENRETAWREVWRVANGE
jgi:phosphohistidine phosphatase